MRILYCAIDQTVPGTKGGSTHVQAVAEGLAARGHEVHVAVKPGPTGFPRSRRDADASVASTADTARARWPHDEEAARETARGNSRIERGGTSPGDALDGAETPLDGGGAVGGAAVRGHASGHGNASGHGDAGRVHWHAIGAPFDRPQLRLVRAGAVRRLAAAIRPDVVMERYHNFGGEGLLAARRARVRAVLEVNAPVIDYPGSPKQRLDRLLLVQPLRRWRDWQCRVADRIVTPTRAILPDWVPAARVDETEWGADTDRFRPGATGPVPFTRDGRTIVVFVGAFRAWHGVHHLIHAMRLLHQRGRADIHAVLIGNGPERASAQAAAAGLDSVTFTGPVPHDALPPCLAAAHIGVAPFDTAAHAPLSLTFFWSPLKVFEYMAAGLPVIAPDLPRLREILGAGAAGLLYDAASAPGAPHALASAIVSLTDPARRAALGAAARDRAVRLYSWAKHCERLEGALQPR